MTVLNFIKISLAFATAVLIVGTGTVAGLFWHFSHGLPDHKQLADYQQPHLDPSVNEALHDYVAQKKAGMRDSFT